MNIKCKTNRINYPSGRLKCVTDTIGDSVYKMFYWDNENSSPYMCTFKNKTVSIQEKVRKNKFEQLPRMLFWRELALSKKFYGFDLERWYESIQ